MLNLCSVPYSIKVVVLVYMPLGILSYYITLYTIHDDYFVTPCYIIQRGSGKPFREFVIFLGLSHILQINYVSLRQPMIQLSFCEFIMLAWIVWFWLNLNKQIIYLSICYLKSASKDMMFDADVLCCSCWEITVLYMYIIESDRN